MIEKNEIARKWKEVYEIAYKRKMLSDRGYPVDDNIIEFCNFLIPFAKVLDIGCGTGIHSYYFKKLGFKVYGIDLSPHATAFCHSKLGDSFVVGTVQALPFFTSSFDGVFATGVLHYLAEEERKVAIEELLRVVTPKGIVYIGVSTASPKVITSLPSKGFTLFDVLKIRGIANILEVKVDFYLGGGNFGIFVTKGNGISSPQYLEVPLLPTENFWKNLRVINAIKCKRKCLVVLISFPMIKKITKAVEVASTEGFYKLKVWFPTGSSLEKYNLVPPPLNKIKSILDAISERWDREIEIWGDIPPCFLGEYAIYKKMRQSIDSKYVLADKLKLKECKFCRYMSSCEGIPSWIKNVKPQPIK
jgi:SAM-dependent methyltransferase